MPMHTGTLSYLFGAQFLEPYRVDRWGGCGPWLFMNLYYMAAVNSDYWLLVGVKIESVC